MIINRINVGVNNEDMFDFLYKDWALTVEGLTEDSISDFVEWTAQYCNGFVKNDVPVYVIKGTTMNTHYGLTGSNAYPDELTIVAIPLSSMVAPKNVAIPRFKVGGRWFTDIVDGNCLREMGD